MNTSLVTTNIIRNVGEKPTSFCIHVCLYSSKKYNNYVICVDVISGFYGYKKTNINFLTQAL